MVNSNINNKNNNFIKLELFDVLKKVSFLLDNDRRIRYEVIKFEELEDQLNSLQKAIAHSRQNQAKILERLDRLETLLQN